MGKIVPFRRQDGDTVKRDEPLPHPGSADLSASRVGLKAIAASLESASHRAKTIVRQLERYKESLSISKDFCEQCMAAAAMSSLAEMVEARDLLTATFVNQSGGESTSSTIPPSATMGEGSFSSANLPLRSENE